MQQPLSQIPRDSLSDAGQNAYKRFSAKAPNTQVRWMPTFCTFQLLFSVIGVHSVAGSPKFAFAVLKAGQDIKLFADGRGVGVKDALPNTSAIDFPGTEDWTSLSNKRTMGASCKVIDAITLSEVAAHVQYDNPVTAGVPTFTIGGNAYQVTDPVLQSVLCKNTTGSSTVKSSATAILYDPSSLVTPPELMSPANLESTFWSACKPHLVLSYAYSQDSTTQVGPVDVIPDGAAKTYLRAIGENSNANRYPIVGGIEWAEDGATGADLEFKLKSFRDIVIPITIPDFGLQGTTIAPNAISLEVRARLHGPEFFIPAQH
jgi:hypothetical protein